MDESICPVVPNPGDIIQPSVHTGFILSSKRIIVLAKDILPFSDFGDKTTWSDITQCYHRPIS